MVVVLLVTACSPSADLESAPASKQDLRPSSGIGAVADNDSPMEVDTDGRSGDEAATQDALTAVVNVPTLTVHAEPDAASAVVTTLEAEPDYPQYLLATSTWDEYQAQENTDWLEVLLPIRPNGSTGWVQAGDLTLYQNRYRVEINVGDYSLTLWDRGTEVFTTPIGVGTGETPTPIGSFYTTVLYDVPDPEGPYGPYAFALSGYSEVLTSFNGGDGLVGIHGTNDPSSLGSDISHGCIRIPNELISQMAETVPLGTPVDIVP